MSIKNSSIFLILLLILISSVNCKKVDSSEKEENYTSIKDTVKKKERRVINIGPDPFGLHDEKHNFILYVSNQSFSIDPVDIEVHIDGELVVSGNFEVKNQHNWKEYRFNLSKGTHKLRVESEKGEARLETEFRIEDKHWCVVDYWYYPGERCVQPMPRSFTFEISDKPIGFM